MIIFLYGQDTYRSKNKLKEIIEHYRKTHKSGLNLRFLDLSDKEAEDFKRFEDSVRQASMFKEKRLEVVLNPFSDNSFKEAFLKKGEEFANSEDIILLFQQGEVRKNDKLFKFLKEKAKSQEFSLLTGSKLDSWVKEEFKKRGFDIKENLAEKLVSFVGNDLWRMENEILKLANYKKGKEIKEEDIELLVKPEIETDIFKTIDAIAKRDRKKALSFIHKHLEKGDTPLYLLSMIGYQIRNVLSVKDMAERAFPYNVILKKSGLHPFVVKKSYSQAKAFSLEELKKIYQKIFEADLSIKVGKIDSETALDLIVAGI